MICRLSLLEVLIGGRVYVCAFIGMSMRVYMGAYICTLFKKKKNAHAQCPSLCVLRNIVGAVFRIDDKLGLDNEE